MFNFATRSDSIASTASSSVTPDTVNFLAFTGYLLFYK